MPRRTSSGGHRHWAFGVPLSSRTIILPINRCEEYTLIYGCLSGDWDPVKAFLLLADAAKPHPDGTFSLLRGGISELHVPSNKPVTFKGSVVARIVGNLGESGPHEFKMVCVNEDGASVAPDLSGNFDFPSKGGTVHLIWDLQLVLPKHGMYEFSIAVDKHQLDVWT